MRAPLVSQKSATAKINVTPIIDVALTLVVILMMTMPMLSVADIDVQVPQAHTRGMESQNRLTITLGRAGEVAIDDDVLSAETFPLEIAKRLQGSVADQTLVVVRADRGAPYEQVATILQQARNAGATRLAVAASPKTEAQQ